MRFRHVIGAFALALAATSCSLGSGLDAGIINVFIDVSDSQLSGGETITFTVTARNVGNGILTLTGQSDCLLFVEVRTRSGVLVWNSNSACTGAQVSEDIAAGGEKVLLFSWNGTNNGGGFLAPDQYNVRAVARTTTGAYASATVGVAVD